MRIYFRNILYLIVFNLSFLAHAGSYEDFFSAVARDDAKAVEALLHRGFDPNTPNPGGLAGLFLALREPSLQVAQVLIDWPKTKVETRNAADESPLMMAALKGHLALVKKLIAKDADVNKPGWTPLHYAATNGHLEIIAILLENHAFIDAESPNKTTPLMMAAHYGSPAAVKLLLDEGADPTPRNQLGLTAFDFAQRGNRKDSASLIASALRTRKKGKW